MPADDPQGTGAGSAAVPGSRADPHAAVRRPATSLLTWGTVAIVLVIVVVLVVIKVTGGQNVATPTGPVAPPAASPAVVKAVTTIPGAVYDAVGVTSPDAAVTRPALLKGQAPLTEHGRPEVLFVGNAFCPYCAVERWAIVAALSRFGTFGTLDAMQSGSNEVFPGTPTFTFQGTTYRSKYLSATLVEHYGSQKNGAGTAYALLDRLTPAERALMARYDAPGPGAPGGLVPFVDVANQAVVDGGQFSPAIFQQLGVAQIASGLVDPKDPATQAIVASANYLSAIICQADGQLPVPVCASNGVSAAAVALGLPA